MTLIEQLKKNQTDYPDKTAILHKDLKISYESLGRQVNALSSFLKHIGFKKGDRAGFLLPKSPEVIISFLGVAKAGGVIFPLDYNQPASQIEHIINLTRPTVLIVSSVFQLLLSKLEFASSEMKIIMVGKISGSECYSWEEIISQEVDDIPDHEIREDDPVYLNFTSGSTGIPKGAITTHANIYWNTRSIIEGLGLTPEDIYLCGFSVFSHPHEIFSWAFYLGGTTVLTDDVLPKTIALAVKQHKVTCMLTIPLVYENLIRYQVSSSALKTLRIAESGGMHLHHSLVENFKNLFKVTITSGWGSTETTGITLSMLPHFEYRPDSIGKPCPYYEAKIVNESGEELPPDEIGEMLVKGPAVCSGYFMNPEESAKHMRDGWMYTGDMVKKDADGYYYFVSRKSRMIKVAGLRVYPFEIEEVLLTHPDVLEAAVVKNEDTTLGEVPRAVVVLRKNTGVTETQLRKYCAGKMAKYKVPAIVEMVSALPKTPSGKILYRNL